MNSLNDSWLDSLVKHSIFKLDDFEKQRVANIKSKKTRQDNEIVNFLLQHHTLVITLRENDLFVAVGSQIRVLNLIAFKDNWLKMEKNDIDDELNSQAASTPLPYKVLETPQIDFVIESLTPNKNGRLLAVKGESKLVVVCLPRQGFSDISDHMALKKVTCQTLLVGAAYYDIYKAEILKIEWHPLSENQTHVVILGNDNFLRIFDISASIEEPEQCFDLSPVNKSNKNQPKIGFSVDDDEDENSEEDAVSFALGGISKDQSGWEPFTVFYTLRNGHMYALCPVIPHRSWASRNHLDKISCISQVKHEQSRNGSEEQKTLSRLFNLQVNWINQLLQSAKITRKIVSNKHDNNILLLRNSSAHNPYQVKRQGPFLISQSNVLEKGTEAADILYINLDPVNIIAVAFTNGEVHNYILGSEIDAQWQMPIKDAKPWQTKLSHILSAADFLPKASMYESINLKSQVLPKYQSMSLVADPQYEDVYYVYHAAGIHAISLNKWVQKLRLINSNFEEGKDQEARNALEAWLKDKATSDVRLLVNTSPYKDSHIPIVGLVIITDLYLSYSLLSVTADYQLVTRELYLRRELTASEKMQDAVKTQLKSLGDENIGYQALLPLPAFQPPAQLDSLPKQPKVVVPADMSGSKEVVITDETLLFLGKSSEKIRRECRDLKKAATSIEKRLEIQQKEFEQQVKTLRDLYDKLQKVTSSQAKTEQERKLFKIIQNHTKLRLRIEEQLRNLMQTYSPDLSNEEKKWVQKLEDLSNKLSNDAGYKQRVELLEEQIKDLRTNSSNLKQVKSSHLNPKQLKSILNTLNEQKNTVNDVKSRFNDLSIKLLSSSD